MVQFTKHISESGHEYEMANPETDLRKLVSNDGRPGGLDLDAIARAEKSLEKISAGFDTWMAEDTKRLTEAREALRSQGRSNETIDAVYRAAFDIRGQAATFGHNAAGLMASSFCDLFDNCEDRYALPQPLIDAYVDAIRAAVLQRGAEDAQKTAQELADTLALLAQKFGQKS